MAKVSTKKKEKEEENYHHIIIQLTLKIIRYICLVKLMEDSIMKILL